MLLEIDIPIIDTIEEIVQSTLRREDAYLELNDDPLEDEDILICFDVCLPVDDDIEDVVGIVEIYYDLSITCEIFETD